MLSVVYRFGSVGYREAYHFQTKLLRSRLDGETADALVLLEHPPTITIGKSGKLENVLASHEHLVKEGVSLFFADRGGDVTYHGPGQLVGYPIIDLRQRERDVHKYVHDLEEVIIRTLGSFSISAGRDKSHAGVWVKNEEVAAIGIRVQKWITMHGFALNVKPDLNHFSFINPCGFRNRQATSISKLLSEDVPMEAVIQRLIFYFSEVFNTYIYLESGSNISARSDI